VAYSQNDRNTKFIWFATRQGLDRYNGNNISIFRPIPNESNSLGESLILHVCGDKNGHVFILTPVGVNKFDLRSSRMKLIQKKVVDRISYGIRNLWIT
jgi:ligand-binding sensor domain-containing protein